MAKRQHRLDGINSETAAWLLHSQCSKKKLPPVNILGKVFAVSEVAQVKGSSLLLVKLYPGLNIVIKKKEMLQWQSRLVPHKEYVFTSLRSTTLEKGGSQQRRVYTVTDKSQLLSPDDVHIDLISISQWLEQTGLSRGSIGPAPNMMLSSENLFSYKGSITEVLDRGLGVFELDKQVRLYLGQVPAGEKIASLHVGDVIIVHNVHYRQTKQIPKLILYCCMLGNTHVEKQSSISAECIKVPALPSILQKYLYLYGLSQQQLDFVYRLRETLDCQFLELFGRRNLEKLMTKVLSLPVLSWKQSTEGPYRNMLDEFIHSPHRCSLQIEQTQQTLPVYMTVKDVLSQQNLPQPDTSTEQWHSVSMVAENQVLLGILKVCEKTGQSMVYDTTGSVSIVTCCCHGNQVKCDHSSMTNTTACSNKCRCRDCPKGQGLPCTRIHTCCRGMLVGLRNFVVVKETKNDSYDPVLTTNVKHRLYLCVDLKDAIVLVDMSKYEKHSKTFSNKNTTATSDKKPNQENVDVTSTHKRLENLRLIKERTNCLETNNEVEILENKCDKVNESKGIEGSYVEIKVKPSVAKTKVSLHRHIQDDGSSRFCRNAACMQYSRETSDGGLPVAESSCSNTGQNKDKLNKTLTEISNKKRDEGSDVIYSVKPINKRRSIDLSLIEQAGCTKKVKQNVAEENSDNCDAIEDCNKPDDDNLRSGSDKPGPVLSNMKDEDLRASNCVDILMVGKEALRPDGQNVDRETLMFCAECRIIRGEGNTGSSKESKETIIAMFKGRAIRWYPCLYNGHMYRLTCPEGYLPLNTPKMPCKKIQKALQKCKAKSWRIVNDDVDVDEIYGDDNTGEDNPGSKLCEISTVLSLGNRDSFVSICGIVTRRVVVGRDQQAPKGVGSHALPSRSDTVNTRVDVQEFNGKNSLQVYMDHMSYCLPLGLIPGAVVTFTSLERKVSRSANVYCRFVALSSVDIICISSDNLTNKNRQSKSCDLETGSPLPRMHLADRWQQQDRKSVFQCVCDVNQISKLSLKCLCEYCGAMIVRSKCSNVSCFGGEEAKMLARASVLVDDGTTVAMVTMTGSSVQDLLQLSHDQWACLEAETKTAGEVFVQQAKQICESPLEQFVSLLCDNRQVKRPWLMTLRHKYTGRDTLDEIGMDEFAQKTFDTGSGRITTHCLPFLQLECVTMETFDPYVCATYYLANT